MTTKAQGLCCSLLSPRLSVLIRYSRSFSVLAHFIHEFSVVFPNSQHAVEISFVRGPLQQANILESFDLGQVAQTGEAKNF
jgi:hypothetical protein